MLYASRRQIPRRRKEPTTRRIIRKTLGEEIKEELAKKELRQKMFWALHPETRPKQIDPSTETLIAFAQSVKIYLDSKYGSVSREEIKGLIEGKIKRASRGAVAFVEVLKWLFVDLKADIKRYWEETVKRYKELE